MKRVGKTERQRDGVTEKQRQTDGEMKLQRGGETDKQRETIKIKLKIFSQYFLVDDMMDIKIK